MAKQPEQKEPRRTLVGGLIIAILIGLAVLIQSLDVLVSGRAETVLLHAALVDAGGLTSGAPVWLAGQESGEVQSVSFLPPAGDGMHRVVVAARLAADRFDQIRRDSEVRVGSDGLMGEPLLLIEPGTAATAGLAAGDTLYGRPDTTVALDARVERLEEQFGAVMDNVSAAGSLFRQRAPALEEIQVRLKVAAGEFDVLASQVRHGPLGGALSEGRLAGRVERIQENLAAVQAGLARYGEGELGARTEALQRQAASLQASLDSVRALTDTPYGFVGRIAADSALTRAMGRAQAQLDSLVQDVTSDPFRYLF